MARTVRRTAEAGVGQEPHAVRDPTGTSVAIGAISDVLVSAIDPGAIGRP